MGDPGERAIFRNALCRNAEDLRANGTNGIKKRLPRRAYLSFYRADRRHRRARTDAAGVEAGSEEAGCVSAEVTSAVVAGGGDPRRSCAWPRFRSPGSPIPA